MYLGNRENYVPPNPLLQEKVIVPKGLSKTRN
jgi:hypothetical protein